SQTMFARRVFELMASNTVVIGNYSRGVKNYFGDLTICTDDANELKYRLDKYCANDESKYQYRLLGLRAVLKEHLYEDRLDFIIKKVFGKSIKPNPIHIDVFSYVKNQNQFNKVLAMFNKQSYQNKSLTILSDIELENNNNDIKIIKSDNNFTVENMFSNSYISYFEANNFYGENYLLDFALSLRYTNFDAIGKSDFYIMDDNGSFNVPNFNNSYKKVDALKPHSSMLDSNYYGKLSISNIIDNITINDGDLFSADQFNYCINCSCDNPSSDAEIEDIGISLDKINKISSSIITNAVIKTEKTFDIRPLEVEKTIFDKPEKINLIKTVQGLTISSNLDNEEYSCAQYNNDFYSVKPFLVENKLSVLFEGIGDLSILGSCVFYENKKEVFKVDNIIFNTTQKIVIPTNVNKVQFGIKVIGSGSFIFNKAIMGENYLDNDEIYFVSRNENLLISDSYPHYENEILDYPLKKIQDLFIGKTYDVVCVNNFSKNGFREYKGINVFETHEKQLIEVLNNINTNKNIVVYTLNKEIENIVKKYNSNFKILTENNEILND
ncbi:MAG: glycosyltransferase family 1 protein, partial [Christensenellaceae bacterium]|nr:glycosyltransferase family 1 protein [Christensenellaceae bacterium]